MIRARFKNDREGIKRKRQKAKERRSVQSGSSVFVGCETGLIANEEVDGGGGSRRNRIVECTVILTHGCRFEGRTAEAVGLFRL